MTPTETGVRAPLVRPRRAIVGGVCAGLAEHLGWPVRRVRLLMVVASLLGGAGILLYGWLWALVPLAAGEPEEKPRRRAPIAAILLLLGAAAAVAAIVQANVTGSASTAVSLSLALIGGAVVWSLALDESDPDRSARYRLVTRSAGATLLLATGLLLLASNSWRPDAMTAVVAVGMMVLGLAVAIAPFIVRLWNELMRERSGRIREEQRAEIAAHLHDSVLQTLALIQNRAGASSDVARIARAQERELREWLFAGDGAPGADLVSELREDAATIEVEYPARIDVVTVGESLPAHPSVVAAAREAMLNAARHGGGEVSVYVEAAASAVDVFVRDRGPGIDLDALPADRLGVRESIIGRMQRAGGTATVQRGAGGVGTEVHLHLDL